MEFKVKRPRAMQTTVPFAPTALPFYSIRHWITFQRDPIFHAHQNKATDKKTTTTTRTPSQVEAMKFSTHAITLIALLLSFLFSFFSFFKLANKIALIKRPSRVIQSNLLVAFDQCTRYKEHHYFKFNS